MHGFTRVSEQFISLFTAFLLGYMASAVLWSEAVYAPASAIEADWRQAKAELTEAQRLLDASRQLVVRYREELAYVEELRKGGGE